MSREPRARFKWWWIPVAAFLVLMTINVQAMLRAEPPMSARRADLAHAKRTVPAPRGTDDERELFPPGDLISGPGIVEPASPETHVAAAVPGTVARIAVVEGAHVEAGAVLVELASEVERAALAAAEAEVDAARAQLDRAVKGSRSEDVAAAIADADTAKARAELSKGVAERLEKAVATGGVTQDELERARRAAEADASAARAADARRQAVLAGSRREDVRLARAQLAAAEARREQAKAQVERLVVRAPIAGEVLAIGHRVGEFVAPSGAPLVVLADTATMTVRMDVDERDVGQVAIGAPVTIRANAYPGVDFTGKVTGLARRMGRKNLLTEAPGERVDTKILEVIITLDAPKGLFVGQRVICYVAARTPGAGDVLDGDTDRD